MYVVCVVGHQRASGSPMYVSLVTVYMLPCGVHFPNVRNRWGVFTPFTAARDRERRTRYTTARGLSAGRVEPNRFAWFLLEEVRAQVWRATIPVT